MRQLYATLRHRPAPLAGILVALTMTAMFVTWALSLGEAAGAGVPAQRLANAAVVVTGNQTLAATSGGGPSDGAVTVPLSSYRRVPARLLSTLMAVPGVRDAVADQSVPVALVLPDHQIVTGTNAGSLTGYGWQSAVLTPFRLQAGHAPVGPGQIVAGAGVAAAAGLRVGDRVSLAGRPGALFTVAGIAAAPAGNPAGSQAVFFSPRQAAVLYGHPGQADLIGIVARPGTSPAGLAARVRAALSGQQVSVVTGNNRGEAENLGAASDLSSFSDLAVATGIINVLVSLFVAASTVALSVAERTRSWALLRAVGATPGQVRRMVMAELAVLGVLAGAAGYLPGIWLASVTVRGFVGHQLAPASVRSWANPVEILPAAAAAIVVAEISGFLSARRASRVRPAVALGEAAVERRYPGPLRLVLGAAALVAGAGITASALRDHGSTDQINLASEAQLAFLAAAAFLVPYLIGPAERVLRFPLRVLGGTPGRLASAELRVRSRRMGAAAVAIALPVAYLGGVVVINATTAHVAVTQSSQRLAAAAVVSAPGPGLDPSVMPAIRQQPGVSAAVGLTPTTVYLVEDSYPGNTTAEAVTPGSLPAVLRLAVTSGSLQHFGPGDIALSQAAVAGTNLRVGQTIMTYLADGVPYPAKIPADFARTLGFADALIPAAAAGGGHLGTSTLSQVLIGAFPGTSPATLAAHTASLAARYPGLQVASRSVVNAQYEQNTSQDSYINNLLLSIIGLLVSVALVNTLALATLQRRKELAVLRRVGATASQLAAAAAWQAAGLTLIGVVLGIAALTATVTTVAEASTGSPMPSIPWPSVTVILGLVTLLTGLAILAPTIRMITKHKGA
jgi:putative ABC transport system permease protein